MKRETSEKKRTAIRISVGLDHAELELFTGALEACYRTTLENINYQERSRFITKCLWAVCTAVRNSGWEMPLQMAADLRHETDVEVYQRMLKYGFKCDWLHERMQKAIRNGTGWPRVIGTYRN